MTPLAPGVWLARGGTHNSFVIEMADHLVIFEPPLFEGRSEGVIAAAKQSAPGKPIRHIVLSHFHDDDMGGVRTYAAEGATVVVHSSAGDYIRAVLDQRRTVEPDRLEMARRGGRQSQTAVMLVEDAITLTDGTREVKLYHAPIPLLETEASSRTKLGRHSLLVSYDTDLPLRSLGALRWAVTGIFSSTRRAKQESNRRRNKAITGQDQTPHRNFETNSAS